MRMDRSDKTDSVDSTAAVVAVAVDTVVDNAEAEVVEPIAYRLLAH